MKYTHWVDGVSEDTLKHVLKTINYILDNADNELTETELNKLHYCWDIIEHIYHYNKQSIVVEKNNDVPAVDQSSTNPAAIQFVTSRS